MGVKWTDEQQKVIDTRNRNLLVSAAAGSGKTAVLVERIIQMLTDNDHPVDIDKLLVVTFTNAAASEMRERIGEALEKRIDEQPDNVYLHKQLSLLPTSNIMTIHAFCLSVIKNNFHIINLDPSFRVADETELKLLKADIINELLEEHYTNEDEDFIDLIESYTTGKTDANLEELIQEIHTFAMSHPWPEEWLDRCVDAMSIDNASDLEESSWIDIIRQHLKLTVDSYMKILSEAEKMCELDNGPIGYRDAIVLDLKNIKALSTVLDQSFKIISEEISSIEFGKIGRCKKDVDTNLKDKVKIIRDEVKEGINKLKEDFFFKPFEKMIEDINKVHPVMETLVKLVKEFSMKFQETKADKNIIDFNDIEHFALNILISKDENGEVQPSSSAVELQDQFHEILIDEYQDSNLVQETILTSVSKILTGKPNVFMVGDVKQSIYKFRLAKPELFMEKYDAYTIHESDYQKIDLHKNFRSRAEILDSINFIFKQIMSKHIGDVEYDDSAALYLGASYESSSSPNKTDLIIIDSEDDEDESDIDSKELEAKVIAEKIKGLMNKEQPFQVYDKKENAYRPVAYKDIVILLRTTSNWANIFVDELMRYGIPAYTDATTGYFDTIEVKTIISLLKIIDNPRQDIPLISVLRSPIVGLTAEELVSVKNIFPNGEFYDAYEHYIQGSLTQDGVNEKLQRFHKQLLKWREMAVYTPLNDLIWDIYSKTHYYHYVSVMPGGQQRQANLDLLIDKAIDYESTSYKGLFNFIRYLEKIHKYAIDLGEATLYGENENLVRVMSIHKSKGLEFPVVFVAGLGKQFNMQDLNKPILLHQDLGFGPKYVNYEYRYETKTLPRTILSHKIKHESLSEELRVLYVALTRAREKLILVGSTKQVDKKIDKWCQYLFVKEEKLIRNVIEGARNYLDLIVPTIARHKDGCILRERANMNEMMASSLELDNSQWHIEFLSSQDIIHNETERIDTMKKVGKELLNWDCETQYSDGNKEYDIDNLLNWQYYYENTVYKPVKITVSEIKRKEMEEIEDEIKYTERESYRPQFIEDKLQLTPGERGTVFHKVMQHIDFNNISTYDSINQYLCQLESRNIITDKERKSVNIKSILEFGKSSLITRMREAEKKGLLRREKPFVLGLDVTEVYDDINSDMNEKVLLQGIIDCYFQEEDQIILVDYKTDYIKKGEEEILIKRYNKQMEIYQRAIEQITGKKVREKVLYSFTLHKEIVI